MRKRPFLRAALLSAGLIVGGAELGSAAAQHPSRDPSADRASVPSGPGDVGRDDLPVVLSVRAVDGPSRQTAGDRAALRREVEASGRGLADPEALAVRQAARRGSVRRARVEALSEVESLLRRARQRAAELDEGKALALLARAAEQAEAHADVPGSAAWLAEVYTALGITAFQAGLGRLADEALARAATLDPGRSVRAAEAAPTLVRRARDIGRAVQARPVGTFEVRCPSPNARVLVDGEAIGEAPATVRVPVGSHVVRVEAPGYFAWGRRIDVLEGARAPLRVLLSPVPELVRAQELSRALAAGEVAPIQRATARLARAGVPVEAWVVWVGMDRAAITACRASGCSRPRWLDRPLGQGLLADPSWTPSRAEPADEVARAFQSRRGWLTSARRPAQPAPRAPVYRRWYVWGASAVAVGAAAFAIGWSLRPEPRQQLNLRVDFGDTAPP